MTSCDWQLTGITPGCLLLSLAVTEIGYYNPQNTTSPFLEQT